jgi:hypothetical protein
VSLDPPIHVQSSLAISYIHKSSKYLCKKY